MYIQLHNGVQFIKQNDTGSQVQFQILGFDKLPYDLTDKNVEVVIGNEVGRLLVKPATILDATNGIIEWGLDEGDLLPSGTLELEVHIQELDGDIIVAPSKKYYKLRVEQAIDELDVVVTTYTLQFFLDQAVATIEQVGDMNAATAQAVAAALNADVQAGRAEIAAETLENTEMLGAYKTETAYKKNNVVTFNGSSYMAKVDTQGNPPPTDSTTPENTEWAQVGRKGSDGEGTVRPHRDVFIANSGQTVFNLSNAYDQFQNMISVTVNGSSRFSPDDFTETSSTSITFTSAFTGGEKVVVSYFGETQPIPGDLAAQVNGIEGTVNNHTAQITDITVQLDERDKQTYIINNSQFGISNDGTNSQATTEGINNAIQDALLKGYKHIVLTEGTYLIKPVRDGWIYPSPTSSYLFGISFKNLTGVTFELTKNTILKCDVSSCYNGHVISVSECNNLTIKGGKIDGNRENHIYTRWNTTTQTIANTHENFFNIIIMDSQNIIVEDMSTVMAVGDSLMVSGKTLDTVYIKNCVISDSRRNNISFTDGKNVFVKDCKIMNAGSNLISSTGVAPRFGMDIEGYKDGGANDEFPKNVVVDNCIFTNNRNASLSNFNGDNVIVVNSRFDKEVSFAYGSRMMISNNIFSGDGTGYAINSIGNATHAVTEKNIAQGNLITNYNTAFSCRSNDMTIRNNTVRDCDAFASVDNAISGLELRNNNSKTLSYFLKFSITPSSSLHLIENNNISITGTTTPFRSIVYASTGLNTSNVWLVLKNNHCSASSLLYNFTGATVSILNNSFIGTELGLVQNTAELTIIGNKFSKTTNFMNLTSNTPVYFEFSDNYIDFIEGVNSFTGFNISIAKNNQFVLIKGNRFNYGVTSAINRGVAIGTNSTSISNNVYILQNTILTTGTGSLTNGIYSASDQYGQYKIFNNILKGVINAGAGHTQSGNIAF